MSTHRRTWDTKEWELRAKERISSQPEPYKIWASQKSHRPKFLDKDMSLKRGRQNQEKQQQMKETAANPEIPAKEPKVDKDGKVPMVSKRIAAKSRSYNFDFEGAVGKTSVVTGQQRGNGNHAGYYCHVCDCTLADSQSWLGHLNGRRHQKNLGLSVFKHTQSNLDDVTAAMSKKKEALSKKKEEYNFQQALKNNVSEEQYFKKKYKDQKKAKKRAAEEEQAAIDEETFGGMDPEMAAMMGFGGFGGKKKKN